MIPGVPDPTLPYPGLQARPSPNPPEVLLHPCAGRSAFRGGITTHTPTVIGREYGREGSTTRDLPSEQALEQALRLLQSLLGENDRLRLAYRVGDQLLLVQSCHGVPIKAGAPLTTGLSSE